MYSTRSTYWRAQAFVLCRGQGSVRGLEHSILGKYITPSLLPGRFILGKYITPTLLPGHFILGKYITPSLL